MAAQTIFKNESATLSYHPIEKIVHHEFHNPAKGAAFQAVLLGGLDLVKKHKAQKWLSDDRKNSLLSKEDETWSIAVWTPQVIAAGWKFWAIVMPASALAQINIQRISMALKEKGVTVQFFPEPVAALAWLTGVK